LPDGFCWIIGRQLGGVDGRVVERKLEWLWRAGWRALRRLKLWVRQLRVRQLWVREFGVREFRVWEFGVWEFGVWGLWFRVERKFQLRRAPARRRLKVGESRAARIVRPATRTRSREHHVRGGHRP
jgi:hypothetical protein